MLVGDPVIASISTSVFFRDHIMIHQTGSGVQLFDSMAETICSLPLALGSHRSLELIVPVKGHNGSGLPDGSYRLRVMLGGRVGAWQAIVVSLLYGDLT